MSSVTTRIDEANFKSYEYDLRKLFVWNNRFEDATFKNNTGAAAAFVAGTVLGRDSSDNTIVPFDSANAVNGEEQPLGVLGQDLAELGDGLTQDNVAFCTSGDVAEFLLVFQNPAENKDTVVNSRSVNDWLLSQNMRIVDGDELTKSDNF